MRKKRWQEVQKLHTSGWANKKWGPLHHQRVFVPSSLIGVLFKKTGTYLTKEKKTLKIDWSLKFTIELMSSPVLGFSAAHWPPPVFPPSPSAAHPEPCQPDDGMARAPLDSLAARRRMSGAGQIPELVSKPRGAVRRQPLDLWTV